MQCDGSKRKAEVCLWRHKICVCSCLLAFAAEFRTHGRLCGEMGTNMKKKNIINLIKYHVEKNEAGFNAEAYEIAKAFDSAGDTQLAEYIMSLISNANIFVPQEEEHKLEYLEKVNTEVDMLLLPDSIMDDLLGVVNAVSHNIGINKFLLQGAPGTGKTEAVKRLAQIMERDLYMVDFATIIDSKLGQTQKNISSLFKEINNFVYPEKAIVLFDEIDAIALDRTNDKDLREMGRATSAMLRGMDYMDGRIIMMATTNLYEYFDKALTRRFDYIIDFDKYTREDLTVIAEKMLDKMLVKFKLANKDIRLFRKIINLMPTIPYPGDLKNMIKTAVAFSNPDDGMDYFRRLYSSACGVPPQDLTKLKEQKFTVREMEILTHRSKSSVARKLREE